MRKKAVIIFVIIAFSIISMKSFSQEFRIGVGYENEVLPNFELDGKAEFRTIFESQNEYYGIFQLGAAYGFFKYFSLGGTIRLSVVRDNIAEEIDSDIEHEIEEVIRYTGDFKYKAKRFKNDLRITNRFRYQYSDVDAENKRTYLRDKIGLDYKMNKRVKPYIALEPYWRLEKNELRKIRIYIGNELDILKNTLEISFIMEANMKDSEMFTFFMVGLNYKF